MAQTLTLPARYTFWCPMLILGLTAPALAGSTPELDSCILATMASAEAATTVGEIRQACESQVAVEEAVLSGQSSKKATVYEQDAIQARYAEEAGVEERAFAITPYRPNYILWTQMDEANQAPFQEPTGLEDPVEDREMQFQVSIKAPVWRNMFGSTVDTYVAYTSRSYWQLFNDDLSAPFRETNYEPEIYLRDLTSYDFLGVRLDGWGLGINHQSNGRGDPTSRSWNRIMGKAMFSVGSDLGFLLRTWYRIPEDEEDDDNPGIYKYLGYGDIRAVWTPNRNTFTAMVRPGTEDTGFELTWSYPISKVFRVYAQYFNGTGESLIDYDYDMERFSIGIALNDYLQNF